MSIIDDKWKLLFDRYDIEKKVSESGPFYITADQIREYKEPRLMTKFDTRESLPSVFGSRLGILPVTRGTYVIGDFDLYADFPEQGGPGNLVPGTRVPGVKKAAIPDYMRRLISMISVRKPEQSTLWGFPVFWMTFWAVRTLSRRYPAGWPPVNLRFR